MNARWGLAAPQKAHGATRATGRGGDVTVEHMHLSTPRCPPLPPPLRCRQSTIVFVAFWDVKCEVNAEVNAALRLLWDLLLPVMPLPAFLAEDHWLPGGQDHAP